MRLWRGGVVIAAAAGFAWALWLVVKWSLIGYFGIPEVEAELLVIPVVIVIVWLAGAAYSLGENMEQAKKEGGI